ncbi:Lrp/AsnC family transcriptional regulator [Photobacterium atrarenae]|uniref:Lrp/AsnC family transcriptional regulator n=1 Tax=Photobacterium atrarenae TaxID=865757 RepID=A0ABY5GP31_9GAMM|nr:Lrp/AsnC family transcriptional regulator [Photobacterium atrarenae]UTV30678.1 Lrp/AsnC family transcriptional regulator [Photobacterium atrarenae]
MDSIDHIDRQLIGHLRMNARQPVAWLAKAVGVSRATIQNRMSRLEKRGIINGYTALVSSGANEQLAMVRALMSIDLEGDASRKVRTELMSEPCVCAIHSTNGRWDMVLELQARSLEEFDGVLGRIREINGISTSETSILLSSHRIGNQHI